MRNYYYFLLLSSTPLGSDFGPLRKHIYYLLLLGLTPLGSDFGTLGRSEGCLNRDQSKKMCAMAQCDRNLAVELVLDFLRTPAETTCVHLAVYDNNFGEYWTGRFKLLSKKFARPKVKWMPFKSCECLRCRSGGCVYCNRTSNKWNSRSQPQAS